MVLNGAPGTRCGIAACSHRLCSLASSRVWSILGLIRISSIPWIPWNSMQTLESKDIKGLPRSLKFHRIYVLRFIHRIPWHARKSMDSKEFHRSVLLAYPIQCGPLCRHRTPYSLQSPPGRYLTNSRGPRHGGSVSYLII